MHDPPRQSRRWFRQPLLHFLAMGALLFALFEWTSDSGSIPAARIVVDSKALLGYAQSTSQNLDAADGQRFIDNLSDEEFDALLRKYVREEVLYREAIAMGLQQDDTVIRQRLIEQLEFIQGNLTAPMREIEEHEIVQHYEAHRSDYRQVAQITFAHVFFDNRSGGKQEALRRAQAARAQLNESQVPFSDGAKFGDAYHYQPNYVQRAQEMIANHFSQRMAAELFALPVAPELWAGPLESPYGQHVVLITQRSAEGVSPLDEVHQRVSADVRRTLARDNRERAIQEIIDSYDVEVDLDRSPATAMDSSASTRQPEATP